MYTFFPLFEHETHPPNEIFCAHVKYLCKLGDLRDLRFFKFKTYRKIQTTVRGALIDSNFLNIVM